MSAWTAGALACYLRTIMAATRKPRRDPLTRVEKVGDPSLGSLVIEGDNLTVLDALAAQLHSQVRVIYIDPPYNTGHSHFRFQDRFGRRAPSETRPVGAGDWVTFMRPRLERLREVLTSDGVIFVSIDDHELFRLGALMDEVFGQSGRLATLCWEKKYGTQNDARWFSDNHEYLLCYAKDRAQARIRQLPRTLEMDARYKNLDGDPRGPWKPGDFSVKTPSETYVYSIRTPSGRVVWPPSGRSWCTSKARARALRSDGRLYFGRTGSAKPQLKQFLSEVQGGRVPSSLWRHDDVGHTDTAKKELKRILDMTGRDFQTPKPTALVRRCLELVMGPDDLALDAFAGTGTTGQVVLEMNRDDGGRRRFVLVESGDGNDRFCRELTVERLRRVVTGAWAAGPRPPTGGGFTFARLP